MQAKQRQTDPELEGQERQGGLAGVWITIIHRSPPTTPTTNHAISPVGTSRFLPVEKASCDQVLEALSNLYFSLDESQQVPGDSSHSTCLHSDQWSFNSYYPLFLVSMNKTCWPKNRLPQTGNGKAAVRRWVWSFWRGNLG